MAVLRHIIGHLPWHGVAALLIAISGWIALQGAPPGMLMLFGFPPLLAVMAARNRDSPATRFVAWCFLAMIGLGACVAELPMLFPNLGGIGPPLPPAQQRLLAWYTGVYLLWFTGVCPITAFLMTLRAHKNGEPTQLSRATCYLGLFTCTPLAFGSPMILGVFLGFWPVF
jgi:hypothetical protein